MIKIYRYYSIERPVSIGTYPKVKDNKPVNIHNFDIKIYIPEIKCEAYGYIEYENKLTDKQIADYELKEPKIYEARPKFNRTSHKWGIAVKHDEMMAKEEKNEY